MTDYNDAVRKRLENGLANYADDVRAALNEIDRLRTRLSELESDAGDPILSDERPGHGERIAALEKSLSEEKSAYEELEGVNKGLCDRMDEFGSFYMQHIAARETVLAVTDDLLEEIDRQNRNPTGFDIGKVTTRADIVRTARAQVKSCQKK